MACSIHSAGCIKHESLHVSVPGEAAPQGPLQLDPVVCGVCAASWCKVLQPP